MNKDGGSILCSQQTVQVSLVGQLGPTASKVGKRSDSNERCGELQTSLGHTGTLHVNRRDIEFVLQETPVGCVVDESRCTGSPLRHDQLWLPRQASGRVGTLLELYSLKLVRKLKVVRIDRNKESVFSDFRYSGHRKDLVGLVPHSVQEIIGICAIIRVF